MAHWRAWSGLLVLLARRSMPNLGHRGYGNEDFPTNVLKAFPLGTKGRISTDYYSSVPQITFVFSLVSFPQSPGLYRLLDLSRANITAKLDSWRFSRKDIQNSFISEMHTFPIDFFTALLVICSCVLICLFFIPGLLCNLLP